MKMMKKTRYVLLVAVILAMVLICGCGNAAGNGQLTRAEYIGLVSDEFGYSGCYDTTPIYSDVNSSNEFFDQIQATAEWDVIEKSGKFKPGDAVTLKFAIETAVKAIGVDKLEICGEDTSDLMVLYAEKMANIDISNPNQKIDRDIAKQILEVARKYDDEMEIPQYSNIEFADGVKNSISDIVLNADGVSGKLLDPSSYSVGDVVYVNGNDNVMPKGIKIESISGDTFTYSLAQVEEIMTELQLYGTYEGVVTKVVTADGNTEFAMGNEADELMKDAIVNCNYGTIPGSDVKPSDMAFKVQPSIGTDHVVFNLKKDDLSAKIGVKNIKINSRTDAKFDLFKGVDVKQVDFDVEFDTEVSVTYEYEKKKSTAESIPLGEMYVQVGGYIPVVVEFGLVANLSADGDITVAYTTENIFTAKWKPGAGLTKTFKSTPELTIEANGQLAATASIVLDFKVGWDRISYSIINADVSTGIVALAKAEIDLLNDDVPNCVDVLVYVPLSYGVNRYNCLLTLISDKLIYSKDIWTSENSPIKKHFHWEDLKRTPNDECTRGQEKIVQDDVDEEGKPFDEYKVFDFKRIDIGYIDIGTMVFFLEPGETQIIDIISVPDGYTEDDLVYTPENPGICTVSGKSVTAVDTGTTTVEISTKDGNYHVYITVTVNDDYTIENYGEL